VAIFRKRARNKLPVIIHGDGMQTRVFTRVEDIVDANMAAWHNLNSKGQVYNCAGSKAITIRELAAKICNCGIVYAKPLEGDIMNFSVNCEKIKRDLDIDFKPITDFI
jgi:UDP-glucose 4-epimerase